MYIKDKLRALMAAQELNPERLAARLQEAGHQVSYAAVVCWYYGRRTPDLVRAKALAEVLGVTLDELVSDSPLREEVAR